MTRDERILQDLNNNLRDKLLRNISDYVALCTSAELTPKSVMAELMVTLVQITASFAAHQFDISPAEFAATMGRQFEHARRVQAEED